MIRLDTFIQEEIKVKYGVLLSRQFVEMLLEKGGVTLHDETIKKKGFKFNPEIAKPEINLSLAEKIITQYQTGRSADEESDKWSESDPVGDISIDAEKLKRAGDLTPNILFESDDFVVTYKPPGVLSHPGRGDQTRDSMVYQFMKYMSDVHQYIPRAGLLHRLDFETQGILLFAKNMEAYNLLKRDFEQRNIEKYYFALTTFSAGVNNLVTRNAAETRKSYSFESLVDAWNTLSPEILIDYVKKIPTIEVEGYIGNVRGTKRMRFDLDKNVLSRNNVNTIKDCASLLSFLKYERGYGAIIRPNTGRTHQIRAQLKFLGVPCQNDPLYGEKTTQGGILKLVAFAISFNFKGQKYMFVLPQRFLQNFF